MIVVPYQPHHLESLLLQPNQAYMRSLMTNPEYQKSLDITGKAFTAIDGETVLACAGIVPFWEGRAEAWAIMSHDLKRHFLLIHRATERFLDACGFPRVEANVDANFGCAQRWMDMLGFVSEGLMHKYTPDGRDCTRFARIR